MRTVQDEAGAGSVGSRRSLMDGDHDILTTAALQE